MTKFLLLIAILPVIMLGCDDSKDAEELGEEVGEKATKFLKGAGKGAQKELKVAAELSEEMTNRGLTSTIAKLTLETRSISVYLISEKEFSGAFVAKALDEDGNEIGRSRADVSFTADDAQYILFTFHDHTDLQLVEKYTIAVSK